MDCLFHYAGSKIKKKFERLELEEEGF